MLRKLVVLSSLLISSMSAHAALISHFGYERDSASNIVTGGGLEWLKWDVTKGMSVNTALEKYGSQGWRLASNAEMASTYNRFSFGRDVWYALETMSEGKAESFVFDIVPSSHTQFINLFGATSINSCSLSAKSIRCYADEEPDVRALAIFGSDSNQNGKYNYAEVVDDSIYLRKDSWTGEERIVFNNNVAQLYNDRVDSNDSSPTRGVALVRSGVSGNVEVPTPASIGLLALGLVALGVRRQVLSR